MKILMTHATSGPGPAKQNYRMSSILGFLKDFVSGGTMRDEALVWATGSSSTPILQSDKLYAIHRTLISADMDPTSCSPNTTVQALFIALCNKHAVTPGWYQYSNSKRSGILCRVFVEANELRAVEIRHDPYGVQHNFQGAKEAIASHMEQHLNVLRGQLRNQQLEARAQPANLDRVIYAMKERIEEVSNTLQVCASDAQVEALLDQLRELYDFSAKDSEVESLWTTLVMSVQDTAKDQADVAAHIESRKKRRGEPDEASLRALLRKLGYTA